MIRARAYAAQAGALRQVAFSPAGDLLATTSSDGSVRFWRLPDGGLQRTLRHPGGVTSVAFREDGGALARGSTTTEADP